MWLGSTRAPNLSSNKPSAEPNRGEAEDGPVSRDNANRASRTTPRDSGAPAWAGAREAPYCATAGSLPLGAAGALATSTAQVLVIGIAVLPDW